MGLHVHNLGNLPADAEREYFVYMLDYGWHEPLAEAMRANFTNMARLASRSKSVVIAGVDPIHLENEVFSFHGINGEDGKKILPALMITTLHPKYFKEHNNEWRKTGEIDDKLLLIPLKQCCNTTSEVVSLIQKIFTDIESKKSLPDFEVQQELKKDNQRTILDAFILQPNISGIGVDLKRLFRLSN